jgi:hypothetical protein
VTKDDWLGLWDGVLLECLGVLISGKAHTEALSVDQENPAPKYVKKTRALSADAGIYLFVSFIFCFK